MPTGTVPPDNEGKHRDVHFASVVPDPGPPPESIKSSVVAKQILRPLASYTSPCFLYTVQELNSDQFVFKMTGKSTPAIDLVTGDDALRLSRYTLDEILTEWAKNFQEMSKAYYIYK